MLCFVPHFLQNMKGLIKLCRRIIHLFCRCISHLLHPRHLSFKCFQPLTILRTCPHLAYHSPNHIDQPISLVNTFRPRQLSIPSASVSSQFYPLPFGIASEPSSAVLTAYRQSPPPSQHSHSPPVQPCFPEMPVSLKLATACSPDLSESSEPAHPSLNR